MVKEKLRLDRIAAYFPDIPVTKLKKDNFSQWKNDLLETVQAGTVRRIQGIYTVVHSFHLPIEKQFLITLSRDRRECPVYL